MQEEEVQDEPLSEQPPTLTKSKLSLQIVVTRADGTVEHIEVPEENIQVNLPQE